MDMKQFKQALPSAILSSVMTLLLLVMLVWFTTDTEEDSVDDMTVTIEYDCRAVMMKPEQFPQQVIDECRTKIEVIKEVIRATT